MPFKRHIRGGAWLMTQDVFSDFYATISIIACNRVARKRNEMWRISIQFQLSWLVRKSMHECCSVRLSPVGQQKTRDSSHWQLKRRIEHLPVLPRKCRPPYLENRPEHGEEIWKCVHSAIATQPSPMQQATVVSQMLCTGLSSFTASR